MVENAGVGSPANGQIQWPAGGSRPRRAHRSVAPSLLTWALCIGALCTGGGEALAPAPAGWSAAGWWSAAGLGLTLLAGAAWWIRQGGREASLGDYLRPDRPARGYLGVNRRGRALRPDEDRRCQHTLLIAPQPAEVTRRFLQPSLLLDAHDGVSTVTFDTWGEGQDDPGSDLRATLPALARGHDVQVFAPFEPHTLHFFLLGAVDTAEAAAGVAGALLAGQGDTSPEFRAQQALLEGLLLDARQRHDGSLRWVLGQLQAGPDALSADLAQASREARQRTHLFFSLRQEQQTGVAAALAGLLQIFADEGLDRATRAAPASGSEMRRPGDELDLALALSRPVAVHLRLPAGVNQTVSGGALLRLLQHTVLRGLLQAGAQLGGAPPQHVCVYLPALAPGGALLPELATTLAALRLTRVACHLTLLSGPPDSAPSTEPEALTAAVGLFGHVLTMDGPNQSGLNQDGDGPAHMAQPYTAQLHTAQLRLADGRHTTVWLPALNERRLGRVVNPLFEGARQAQLPGEPSGAELTQDLVLRRLLAARAGQAAQQAAEAERRERPTADADGLRSWVDAWLSGDQSGPQTGPGQEGGAPSGPAPDQLERWRRAGWLSGVADSAAPALTPAGLELLDEDRRRVVLTRMELGELELTQMEPFQAEPAGTQPEPGPTPPAPPTPEGAFENPVEARHDRLLVLLAAHRDLTPAQIVAMTELPETTVRRDLGVLEEQGQVQSARVAGKRRYRLKPGRDTGSPDESTVSDGRPGKTGESGG